MRLILLTLLILILPLTAREGTVERAEIAQGTVTKKDLMNLPDPRTKVVVAVYNFRDQTGQYRPITSGNSYSTAVTQGSTSMLVKALEESHWFTIVEREGLNNLINERKIIALNREADGTSASANIRQVPTLLAADILLEGGIISYETNLVTGGFGAKYLGIGGNESMQKDRVTIYLRAISTKTGEVIKSVNTSKTIISRMTDAGVYRFVSFKRLLEVETGFSVNEPPQLCVQEAIEKAVFALIAEGVQSGLWNLKDSTQINNDLFVQYLEEKELRYAEIGTSPAANHRSISERFSFQAGLYGEVPESTPLDKGVPIIKLGMRTAITENIGISLDVHIHPKKSDSLRTGNLDLGLDYIVLPERIVTPIVHAGGTIVFASTDDNVAFRPSNLYSAAITYGLGIGVKLPHDLLVESSITNHTLIGNSFTGKEYESMGTRFWSGGVTITIYPWRLRK